MAKTVERRIFLTEEEDERLQQRASERGVSAEEWAGDAVRRMLGAEAGEASEDDRAEARRQWADIVALMRARAALPATPEYRSGGRGWTREEMYDERPRRFAGRHEPPGVRD